jgi:DNA-binding NarL/FixJ family response regulator
MAGRIIVVASDLMRQSRVVEGARALGYDVVTVASHEALRDALRSSSPDLLVVDLQAEGVPWREAVAEARKTRRVPILAFGQHTKPAVLRAARAAGCDLAAPRSRLVAELPALIERARAADEDVPKQT